MKNEHTVWKASTSASSLSIPSDDDVNPVLLLSVCNNELKKSASTLALFVSEFGIQAGNAGILCQSSRYSNHHCIPRTDKTSR